MDERKRGGEKKGRGTLSKKTTGNQIILVLFSANPPEINHFRGLPFPIHISRYFTIITDYGFSLIFLIDLLEMYKALRS